MVAPEIRVRTWVHANDEEARSGLLGYLSVYYGDLVLDGICVRLTADRRFALSFPSRTDRSGRRHAYIRPAHDTARRAIESEIIGQLRDREGAPTGSEDLQ